MLKIHIETGNAAFADEPATEMARILRDLADQIEDFPAPYTVLFDVNGNAVGECEISEGEEDE